MKLCQLEQPKPETPIQNDAAPVKIQEIRSPEIIQEEIKLLQTEQAQLKKYIEVYKNDDFIPDLKEVEEKIEKLQSLLPNEEKTANENPLSKFTSEQLELLRTPYEDEPWITERRQKNDVPVRRQRVCTKLSDILPGSNWFKVTHLNGDVRYVQHSTADNLVLFYSKQKIRVQAIEIHNPRAYFN